MVIHFNVSMFIMSLLMKLCQNWEPLLVLIKEDMLSIPRDLLMKGFASAFAMSKHEMSQLTEKTSPSELIDRIDVKLSTSTIPEKFVLFECAYSEMKLRNNFKSMVEKFISFDSHDDYKDFLEHVCKRSMCVSDDFMTCDYVKNHPHLFDSEWIKWMHLFQNQFLQNVDKRMNHFIDVVAHMVTLCPMKSFASNCNVSESKLYEICYGNKNDWHDISVELVDHILEDVLKDKTLKEKVLFFYHQFERSASDLEFIKLLRGCKLLDIDPEVPDLHRIFCSMASRRVPEMETLRPLPNDTGGT